MKHTSSVRCLATKTTSTTTPSLDFSQHTLNLADALKKPFEGHSLSELVLQKELSILQGIGPKNLEAFHKLGIHTLHDLATYKFYHVAKSIVVLANVERTSTARVPHSALNLNLILDKAYQTQSLKELCDAPVACFFGLSDVKGTLLQQQFGCKTIQDLAQLKYCQWAEAIVTLEPYEASSNAK